MSIAVRSRLRRVRDFGASFRASVAEEVAETVEREGRWQAFRIVVTAIVLSPVLLAVFLGLKVLLGFTYFFDRAARLTKFASYDVDVRGWKERWQWAALAGVVGIPVVAWLFFAISVLVREQPISFQIGVAVVVFSLGAAAASLMTPMGLENAGRGGSSAALVYVVVGLAGPAVWSLHIYGVI